MLGDGGTPSGSTGINSKLLDQVFCQLRVHKSIDTVIDETQVVHYPTEFLKLFITSFLGASIIRSHSHFRSRKF